MNNRQNIKKSFFRVSKIRLYWWFRHYPALPYLLKWVAICSVIGLCIGSVSAWFLLSLDWVTTFRENHKWLIFLLPLGGFLIGLLYHYFGKDIEVGNNLLIDEIHNPQKIISLRMSIFIYIGTLMTHLLGGSAGREGTALQMAAPIAYQFSHFFRLKQHEKKVLLVAAVAAGFGSVFGTPLAGAVFGLEFYLIGRLRYDAIFPAFAAAMLADWTTKYWQAAHTHYHINIVPDFSPLNFAYTLLVGAIFGVCAASFSKIMTFIQKIFRDNITFPPLRPLIGGLVVTVAVLVLGSKYSGLGVPTIVAAFEHALPPYDFAVKMLLTILTLAAGFKGGEVTPLFFIGATLGNALNYIVPLPLELLAGMGFVAVFAGATNTPLACLMMGLELFGVQSGVYLGLACVVAYFFSGHNSIYKKQIVGEAKHERFKYKEGKPL